MKNLLELLGQKIGRLVVLEEVEAIIRTNGRKRRRYLCKCDCGNIRIVYLGNLSRGHTKSCGCLKIEKTKKSNTTHGHAIGQKTSRTYKVWASMYQRCTNPKNKHYKNYGGRGITVCVRWLNSFENFLADMGEAPIGMSLDRYPDNNGNYEPENCRWATRIEQARNKRNNRVIEFQGRSMILQDWAKELGIGYGSLQRRLKNWPIERALTESAKADYRREK